MTNDQTRMTKEVPNTNLACRQAGSQLSNWILRHFFVIDKFVIRISITLILVFSFFSPAFAVVDIGDIGMGARPLSLGKAYAGGVDDATSIFTNPAGMAWNRNLNITSMSGTLLSDINYILFGVSDYSPIGKIGIGYVNASIGGIPITTITGSGSTAAVVQTGSTDYSSSVVYFSYSTKLNSILRGKGEGLSLGFNLKHFSQGFSGGGTAMQNAVGSGMDADLGLMWQVNPWAKLGYTFNNFLPQTFGGRFEWEKDNEIESIPMSMQMGGEFGLMGQDGLIKNDSQKLDLLADYETAKESNQPSLWHLGLEYWPSDILAFRVGMNQKPKALANNAGVAIDNNLTGGVGIRFFGFTFDYAYMQMGELSDNVTHFFSFGYRGIDAPKKKRKKRVVKEVTNAIPVPEVVTKPNLITYKDLPDGYWAKKQIEYLASLGIMGGYPDQTFRPDKELNRSELAVLLVKAKNFKIGPVDEIEFSDVRASDWFAPYVAIAVDRKYMNGYPDETFRPNQIVSRAEAALIFARYAGLYMKPKLSRSNYPDVGTKHWASSAIAAGKEAGFYEYISSGDFGLDKSLTRAEAAEILAKTPFVKKKIKELIAGEK